MKDGEPAIDYEGAVYYPRQMEKFTEPSKTILLVDLLHEYNPPADGFNLFDALETCPEYRHPNEMANFLHIDGHLSASDYEEAFLWDPLDKSIIWGADLSYNFN